jgi:hypothetical protein
MDIATLAKEEAARLWQEARAAGASVIAVG